MHQCPCIMKDLVELRNPEVPLWREVYTESTVICFGLQNRKWTQLDVPDSIALTHHASSLGTHHVQCILDLVKQTTPAWKYCLSWLMLVNNRGLWTASTCCFEDFSTDSFTLPWPVLVGFSPYFFFHISCPSATTLVFHHYLPQWSTLQHFIALHHGC